VHKTFALAFEELFVKIDKTNTTSNVEL